MRLLWNVHHRPLLPMSSWAVLMSPLAHIVVVWRSVASFPLLFHSQRPPRRFVPQQQRPQRLFYSRCKSSVAASTGWHTQQAIASSSSSSTSVHRMLSVLQNQQQQQSSESDSSFSFVSPLEFTNADEKYLQLAVECAEKGLGHTFPNPAVGCVLVRSSQSQKNTMSGTTDDDVILGRGFHPRAGFPHAEIFALLEAAGKVPCGVAAAESVVRRNNNNNDDDDDVAADTEIFAMVVDLANQYKDDGGPQRLFENCLATTNPTTTTTTVVHAESDADPGGVDTAAGTASSTSTTITTAYVTLEPCCHYGQTPPCAAALAKAGIARVVVGVRDPNPRVNGGGVAVLEAAGIPVIIAPLPELCNDNNNNNGNTTEGTRLATTSTSFAQSQCTRIAQSFLWRITAPVSDWYDTTLTGRMRRALRTLSLQRLAAGTLPTVSWGGESIVVTTMTPTTPVASAEAEPDKDEKEETNVHSPSSVLVDPHWEMEAAVRALAIAPEWMEHVDGILWQHELVLLRLNRAVSKKRGANLLGRILAEQLRAHVAQTKGHTVLLYRPSVPPF